MVPPTGCICIAVFHHRPYLCSLCQVRYLTLRITHNLTKLASSTLKEHKFERSQLFRSIIQKQEELQAISCSFACFSCTRLRITRFVSNHSRPFGTLITSSSHSCSDFTPMPQGASFATLSSHSLHLTMTISGLIALGTRVGDGNSGEVDSISSSVCTERSDQEGRRRSSESCAIHMVSIQSPQRVSPS